MQNCSGKLIAIDGLDGCGKQTQVDLIVNKLGEMGYKVSKVSFPDYESKSSELVKMYLNGELGKDPNELNPYLCSLFYATDRGIQFINGLREMYDSGYILICDRYISANLIHQGSKLTNLPDMLSFFKWEYDLEVNKINLPHDDKTFILSLPVSVSQSLMNKRYNSDENKKDIHEANVEYLEKCYKTAKFACDMSNLIGCNWEMLDCTTADGLGVQSIEDIFNVLFPKVLSVIEDKS